MTSNRGSASTDEVVRWVTPHPRHRIRTKSQHRAPSTTTLLGSVLETKFDHWSKPINGSLGCSAAYSLATTRLRIRNQPNHRNRPRAQACSMTRSRICNQQQNLRHSRRPQPKRQLLRPRQRACLKHHLCRFHKTLTHCHSGAGRPSSTHETLTIDIRPIGQCVGPYLSLPFVYSPVLGSSPLSALLGETSQSDLSRWPPYSQELNQPDPNALREPSRL